MRRLFAVLALLILPSSVALAAEPSSGEVSPAAPKVEWTGSTTNSYPNYVAMNQDPEGTPCQSPTCDTFTLTVAGGGVDLVIRANMEEDGASGPANTGLRITKPDGSRQWQTGPSGETAELKVTIKKAPAGEYVIDLLNNFVGPAEGYMASAELAVPPAAAPAPAPAPEAAPAPAPETKLTVKPAKVRATKKLKVGVSTTAPLRGVTATLTRGGKRFATGRLSKLSGSRKVTLKARKALKPGRYLVTVAGVDEQGRKVRGQAAVTIRR